MYDTPEDQTEMGATSPHELKTQFVVSPQQQLSLPLMADSVELATPVPRDRDSLLALVRALHLLIQGMPIPKELTVLLKSMKMEDIRALTGLAMSVYSKNVCVIPASADPDAAT